MLPPFGLSGGAMRFDPASGCLWIDVERDGLRRTIDLIEEGTAETGVNILESYSAQWIPILSKMEPESRHTICRMRHELDHLRRHLGTSFGLLYHFINSSFPILFFEACGARSREGGLRFPLFDPSLATRCKALGYGDAARSSEDAGDYVLWQSGRELLRILDGDPPLLDPLIGLSRFDIILSTLAGSPQSVACADQMRHEKALQPFVSRRNIALPQWQGVEFGGRHLLEALAFGSEASLALVTGVAPDLVAEGMDRDHYGLVSEIWSSLVAEPAPVPPEGLNITNDLPLRSLAYLAAVDLALWVPVTPNGLATDGDRLGWSDIHPGWRFLKICEVVGQNQIFEDFRASVEETNEPFRRLQDRICELLDWPTVDRVASEWLDFLASQLDTDQWSGFFWESGKQHPRLVSSTALISRRIAWPYQIAFNYYNFSDVKLMFFPILFTRDGHMVYAKDQSLWSHYEAPEFRRAMPFFVHHGVHKLAEGKNQMFHLGPEYDDALVNFLAVHGSAFGTADDAMRRASIDFLKR